MHDGDPTFQRDLAFVTLPRPLRPGDLGIIFSSSMTCADRLSTWLRHCGRPFVRRFGWMCVLDPIRSSFLRDPLCSRWPRPAWRLLSKTRRGPCSHPQCARPFASVCRYTPTCLLAAWQFLLLRRHACFWGTHADAKQVSLIRRTIRRRNGVARPGCGRGLLSLPTSDGVLAGFSCLWSHHFSFRHEPLLYGFLPGTGS